MISIPTEESHEAIKKVEALRSELGIQVERNYLLVQIATQATEGGSVYQVSWATTEVASQNATSPDGLLAKWRDELGADDVDTYNGVTQVVNSLNTGPNRGAKDYDLLVKDKRIKSRVGPTVHPSGFTSAPCEIAEYQPSPYGVCCTGDGHRGRCPTGDLTQVGDEVLLAEVARRMRVHGNAVLSDRDATMDT